MEEINTTQAQSGLTMPQPPISQPSPENPIFKWKWPLLIIFLLVLVTLPAVAYFLSNSNKQVACTLEAKICPDGSSVGRTGPKCEFTACPTVTLTPKLTAIPTTGLIEKVIWDVQKPNLSQTEIEIKNAFVSYNPTDPSLSDKRRLAVVGVETSSISADFTFTSMEYKDNNNQVLPTGGFEFIVYKNNGVWKIVTGSDSNFCDVLKSGPSDLVNESRKTYYRGCFPE